MDERRYKLLMRIAVALTVAWIGWSLYDSGLNRTAPGGHDLAAARKYLEDGQFAQARELFDRVWRDQPQLLGALRGRAQAQMEQATRLAFDALQRRNAGDTAQADALQHRADALYRAALADYDQAILEQAALPDSEENRLIQGVAHANRGILKDRMGDYAGALADYREALRLNPEVKEGPGLLTRFLRNQAERPPSVADRADYLAAQLALPASQRLLRLPEADARQRAYSMD